MSGLGVTENALGFTAVRLHYSADPEKNILSTDSAQAARAEKWLDTAKRSYPDPNQWAQEMELNWWIAAGRRVYPEFSEDIHVKGLTHRSRKQIWRAWDFGWLTPACLLAQIDERDRLLVLHEVVGKEETTRQFGERVIVRCAEWYPNHAPGFQDVCDPAGQQRSSTSESSEVRDIEVLNSLGIYPRWQYGWTRRDSRALIHQLLSIRADGTPGVYVDGVGCPVLLQGCLGRFVFPPRKAGKLSDEPDETNHPWSDVQACWRYLVIDLFTALGLRRERQARSVPAEPTWQGYGTPKGPRNGHHPAAHAR